MPLGEPMKNKLALFQYLVFLGSCDMCKDRLNILGSVMPETYPNDDKVDEYRVKRGLPFTWHETKSVKLWMQLFKDVPPPGLTHIWDLGAGTAAAGIAAWRCGIKYEGLCVNRVQKDWLDNLMDTCMYAVVSEGVATKQSANDKDIQTKVQHLFGPQVAEGMRMLSAKKAKADASGEPADGEEAEQEEEPGNDEDDV